MKDGVSIHTAELGRGDSGDYSVSLADALNSRM